LVLLVGMVLLIPSIAAAVSCVSGSSVATHTPGHPLGEWEYCVTVDWSTGAYAVSHLDVLLGLLDCPCICDEFPFAAEDTAGSSGGTRATPPCAVSYAASYECAGDPSTPGEEGPLVKFEPYGGECEPGPSGTGTFCFYTDWPPRSVQTPNSLLLIKYGPESCSGELTGDLPLCSCGETATEQRGWGWVKKLFR